MIVKPESMTFADKKIRMLIAGYPGIGKSTLALSAPSPLYIDVDLSVDRIDSRILSQAEDVLVGEEYIDENGKTAHKPVTYEDIRRDLGLGATEIELRAIRNNLSHIKTIVIDTGGKLLTIMGQYGRKIEPKYGQRDGSLSLKGYGWLGKEFQRFLDHCIYELDKHIVIIFHTVEEKDGDDTKLRIKAEGSSRNNVWEVMDLGGFMEMRGNTRTIGFSNCERYFAKGTRGIHGVMAIPELGPGVKNDFLTRLFEQYNKVSEEEAAKARQDKELYETVMEEGRKIIGSLTDAESVNEAMPKFKDLNHALTSQKELGNLWNAKIKELGLIYDKVLGKYTPKEAE